MDKKIAIIICSYNQKELLRDCLKSVKKNTSYKKYKVYLVDDSGTGKIGTNISKKFKWVDLTINKGNKGFSGANNVGIKKAMKEYTPDYVLLLNDDCEIIEKDWLTNLIEAGEEDKKIGILGCNIRYPDLTLQNLGGYMNGWKIDLELNEDNKGKFEVDHVMGACMMIKKEVINKIGFLDEIYSPYLLEDTDYCLRAKENGFKIVSIPEIKVIHNKGKSIDSQEDRRRLIIRFKNDIIFSRKHLKGGDKFFRIFIYLPLVAVFKKKRDTGGFNIRNISLRRKFIRNLYLWFISFFPKIYKNRLK